VLEGYREGKVKGNVEGKVALRDELFKETRSGVEVLRGTSQQMIGPRTQVLVLLFVLAHGSIMCPSIRMAQHR